jgi:hypothetical protein
VTLRRGLCDALAEVLSIEIEPPELPERPADAWPSLVDYLTEHLELNCMPVAHDDAERHQLESAVAVAHTLQLESCVGATLLEDDLADMSAVLGRRPRDRVEGFALLGEIVEDDPEPRVPELVWLFSRIERRREHLWKPMMTAQSSAAFERLGPGSDAPNDAA